MNEFELIARYFTRPPQAGSRVAMAVGDDCALVDAGESQLAVTTDLLLEGRHFLPGADPEALGHKALAVNLSDLAAAGSVPRCFFLALALPRADDRWLAAFARGLFALADAQGCALAGGDTTRVPRIDRHDGPLSICITALGEVPRGQAHTRGGARPGDAVWVSGAIGDAMLSLLARRGEVALAADDARDCGERMDRPQPRVALGMALRGLATSCMDVSDGLLGDLAHICERSGVDARIDWPAVPRSPALRRQPEERQQRCALAGGDDYELLFTAPDGADARVRAAARAAGIVVSRIGAITGKKGAPPITVVDVQGRALAMRWQAFDHFDDADHGSTER